MTSSEIDLILKQYRIYMGTFASDTFRLSRHYGRQAYIINTDTSTGPGKHWIAMIKDHNICYYFDSFGLPIYLTQIIDTLKENNIKKYTYNTYQIQPFTSQKCGYYCLAFILSYLNGLNYNEFLNNFYTNVKKNDNVCISIIEKYISLK